MVEVFTTSTTSNANITTPKGSVLLLMRDTVLGAESIIRPYMNLCLRRRCWFVSEKLSQLTKFLV